MLVAVTGVTGFLGRYIADHLIAQGHTLRCWYRPTSDRTGLPEGAIDWIEGGLRDPESMDRLLDGVDAVVHAALERPPASSFQASGKTDLGDFVEANLMGSLRLMDKARRGGAGRFVFVSTCAVHEVICDDRPLDEKHPLWPTTHYGAHKAAIEAFVHSFGLGEKWPICAVRPCGIYGLAHPASESKYYDLVGDALAGKPISTARGGKEVHAADVAQAIGLLLTADGAAIAGQSYNCCDLYVADEHVAEIAAELAGIKLTIERLNKGPKNQIDTAKIRELGMKFGGEERLRATVKQLVEAKNKNSK